MVDVSCLSGHTRSTQLPFSAARPPLKADRQARPDMFASNEGLYVCT